MEESFMFPLPGMDVDETEQQGHSCFLAEEPWSFCEEQTQQNESENASTPAVKCHVTTRPSRSFHRP